MSLSPSFHQTLQPLPPAQPPRVFSKPDARTGNRLLDERKDDLVYDPVMATADTGTLEAVLMKEIAATLHKHYPPPRGLPFWWAVEVNHSVIYIFNLALSGTMAYVLHVKRGVDTRRIVRAGGEILERYGVPREYRRYSAEQIVQMHKQKAPYQRHLKHHAG